MLVIFDKQTRKQGVKEYLEKGTEGDRNIKDKRVALYGNLDITDKVAELCRKKGYKEAYRNIVLSFEEDLDEQILENIAKDFIRLYMHPYDESEYTAYAEAHLPKKKINSRGYERKNHIHIVIPKYSLKLAQQLDLGDHARRLAEIEKIKEYLEAKYNLKSLEHKKILKEDKAEILNISKYENRNKAKKELENYIKDNIAHYETLDDLISDLEKKLNAEIKTSKNARTPYISIKLPNFNRAIRLKGELFSDKSFKQAKESLLKDNKYIEVKATRKDPQELLKELEEIRARRVARVLKRIEKKRLQAEQELIRKEQTQRVKNYISYAEKLLNKFYNYNFNLDLPKGFFVRRYENTGYTLIRNKKRGIKVLDKGDKIVAQGKNLEEQAKIMIELAIAKGWDLRKVQVTGSDEFKRIANRLIEEKLKELENQKSFSLELAKASVRETQPNSYIQSKLREAKDQQQVKELDLKTLKEVLTAEELLKALKERGLIDERLNYRVENNRIITPKAKRYNIVDFCLKEMNLSFKETSKLLNDIYNANLEEFKEENMQQIDWKQIKRELHPMTIAKYYNLDIKPEQVFKKNDEYRIKVGNRNYNVVDYLLKERKMKFKEIVADIDNLMRLQQQLNLEELDKKIKLTEDAKKIKATKEQEEYIRIINEAKREDLGIFLADYGFKVVKEKTSKNYRVVENDKGERLVVYKKNGKYIYFNVNNDKDKGDVYNFFANRGIKSYKEIAETITGANRDIELKPLEEVKEFKIDDNVIKAIETYKNYKKQKQNDYSYLTDKRMIDEHIVRAYSNFIKSDRNKNIIVPLYNKISNRIEAVGYDRRLFKKEENQPKSYINGKKGIAMLHPFDIRENESNQEKLNKLKTIENVVISENYIDALSYIQLNNLDPYKTAIISTQGTITQNNIDTIKYYLNTLKKHSNLQSVILALDNDEAGRKMSEKLKNELKEYQGILKEDYAKNKDFNDDLKAIKLKEREEIAKIIKENYNTLFKNKELRKIYHNEFDKKMLAEGIIDTDERLERFEDMQTFIDIIIELIEKGDITKEYLQKIQQEAEAKDVEVELKDLEGIEVVDNKEDEIVEEKEQEQSNDYELGL